MLTGGHKPRRERSPYLHTVVLQVDPGLLRLLLLQKLIGLDSSLPGLFRLWATEPHLKECIYSVSISTCTYHREQVFTVMALASSSASSWEESPPAAVTHKCSF